MPAIRRLAAILAADVAGYSRLIGADEEGTLNRLRSNRTDVIDPKISEHRGRIVKTTGDGFLVEFASVVDALRCATEIQTVMAEGNAGIAAEKRIEFRIGINVGDVVVEDGDIFGDGVNVAARLEALANPGGICVSARVQEDAAGKLDHAFEDMGEQSLKNITRSVRVYRISMVTGATSPPIAVTADVFGPANPPRVPRLSIVVLPFTNVSNDPEQEYFADGITDDLTTDLSRISDSFVISRNTAFTYKGKPVDVKHIGRELGVRYVLEGSVRKGGSRVRITAQLIEADTGAHLWADRFDGSLEDVFDLQDKVAINVAGVIEPALQAAEVRRSAARSMNDVTAYDLYLRALATFYPITRERLFKALELLQQAVAIDPDSGPALSLAAMCQMRLVREGWAIEPETARQEAVDLARQALQLAGDDPVILANAAFVLANFGEEIGAMMALIDRALTITPSFSRGWFYSGVLRLWASQHDLAIEHAETALRLSPRERAGTPLSLIGEAQFFKREFDEAASKLLLSVQENPGYPHSYRVLAACYAHMGRLDEARAIMARLRGITPHLVPGAAQLRNPADRELFLSGLRLAAGEA